MTISPQIRADIWCKLRRCGFTHKLAFREDTAVRVSGRKWAYLTYALPLVEAMHAGLPILAHASTAIPETLGESGILVDKKNWSDVLENIKKVHQEKEFRLNLIERTKKRCTAFSQSQTSALWLRFLSA